MRMEAYFICGVGGVSNNFTFLPDSSTTYFVNGTDINGCQNTDSINVQVNAIPTILRVMIQPSVY